MDEISGGLFQRQRIQHAQQRFHRFHTSFKSILSGHCKHRRLTNSCRLIQEHVDGTLIVFPESGGHVYPGKVGNPIVAGTISYP
jgi:hypothetical protein